MGSYPISDGSVLYLGMQMEAILISYYYVAMFYVSQFGWGEFKV